MLRELRPAGDYASEIRERGVMLGKRYRNEKKLVCTGALTWGFSSIYNKQCEEFLDKQKLARKLLNHHVFNDTSVTKTNFEKPCALEINRIRPIVKSHVVFRPLMVLPFATPPRNPLLPRH